MVDWEHYRIPDIPEQLMMYRVVQDYPLATEPVPGDEAPLVGIRNLYQNKTQEYWRQRTALENAFLEFQTAKENRLAKEAMALKREPGTAPIDWDGKGRCPTCGREAPDKSTLEAMERARKWLKEHGDD